MTSETFVLGGPISEKVAIGALVRKYAATLGPGHVEALVENHGNGVIVRDARACPSLLWSTVFKANSKST